MDYIDVPIGRAILPPELVTGVLVGSLTVSYEEDGMVSIYSWESNENDPDPEPGVWGTVNAHLRMPRERWERMPRLLQAMIDAKAESDGTG